MRPKNVDDIYPLTPMQQLMLMHSNQMTGSFVLSNQFQYRITGDLDPARLQQCLQTIQQLHPALRTFFLWEGLREPMQLVHSKPELRFDYVDCGAHAAEDREKKIGELIAKDRVRPFDLSRPPLSRFILVRSSASLYHLVWSRHHLILDRWCVDILFDELFALYDSNDTIGADSLPPRGSFRDYVRWIQSQDNDVAMKYWRTTLAGIDRPTLASAPRRDRAAFSALGLPSVDETLDNSLHESLRELARSSGVSVAIVLQAALALLLSCRHGSEDALFGLTVSGRPSDLPGVEAIMGSFINNVPVRVPVVTELSLPEWLRRIQTAQAKRNKYEHVSPAEIRGVVAIPGGLPTFDVLALFHSPAVEVRRGRSFEIEQLPGPYDSAHTLTLSLAESMGSLLITAVYDPERIDRAAASSLLRDLHAILAEFVATPAAMVSDLREARSDSGIASRAQLADFDYRPTPAKTRVKPDELDGNAAILAEVWLQVLGVERIGLDDDFFALGGTSLQAVEAFSEIEKRLGRVLPLSVLYTAGSIRRLLEELDTPQSIAHALVEIQAHGARPPLFVVPGIGGDTVALSGLARVLGPAQPFYGFQSRGLDGHSAPLTRIDEIAARNIVEMDGATGEPFVLCGICWGSFVALEMARQLQDVGRAPELLVVVDPAYHASNPVAAASKDPRFATLRFVTSRLKLYGSDFLATDPRARWRWLAQKVKLVASKIVGRDPLSGNRSEISRERVLAANMKAQLNYEPLRYDNAIRAVLTTDRKLESSDLRVAWLNRVAPDAPVSYVPGEDTGDLLAGANVGELAGELHRLIDEAVPPDNANVS